MVRINFGVRALERLLPTENGMTVFDAETQETSYGIWFLDGLPFIFDTHRKGRRYVATIELLTEVATTLRISPDRIRHFGLLCRSAGLLPIPYTACYSKGNLHVYSFSGPVRGYDIAAADRSVASVERALLDRAERIGPQVPPELLQAQRELLEGGRSVRHPADLAVLRRHWKATRVRTRV